MSGAAESAVPVSVPISRAALITGGARGIGLALARALAKKGYAITVVDVDGRGAEQAAEELRRGGAAALGMRCDVTNGAEHAAAFAAHMARWGRMDVAVLNAGVSERDNFIWGECFAEAMVTLDLDFTAVAEGVRLAVRCMTGGRQDAQCGGAIMVTASAAGVFPLPEAPIYSASKAACVQLVRALGPRLHRSHGISLTALCPQFADTEMVRGMRRELGGRAARVMADTGGRLLTADQVAEAGMSLLLDRDPARSGSALAVLVDGSWAVPAPPRFKRLGHGGGSAATSLGAALLPRLRAWATAAVPTSARVVEVHTLSTDFRAATRIATHPLPTRCPPSTVLIRRMYTGVNASDINFSDGRYHPSREAAQAALPFAAGFESVGVVASVAPDVAGLVLGQPVATMSYGGFSEWGVEPAKHVLPVPAASPEMLPLLTNGLTASIALEQCGRLVRGERVLVTAAAGGTGHLAVQLAKLAGCHVIATCSGGEKAELLRRLGADRVISYREEDVKEVLKREYPQGVDVVFESVGGNMFTLAVNALAPKGRCIVIGMMSQYAGPSGWQPSMTRGLPEKLLSKSALLCGFFLNHYTSLWKHHLAKLTELWQAGKLHVELDPRSFVGLEAVPDAVEWLQGGRSRGKVYCQVAAQLPPGVPLPAPARQQPRRLARL